MLITVLHSATVDHDIIGNGKCGVLAVKCSVEV